MNRVLRVRAAAVRRLYLRWRFRLFQRHRHRRLVLERVGELPLLVLPDVFNPTLFFTSEVLVTYLEEALKEPGLSVLDMGTGSGVAAITAARRGARVVAVDISPEAVRCARINVLLNRVEERVDVRHGDLFEPVRGERFDLVLFNPPFYAGTPRALWETAWRSDDVLERFARGLPDVLTSTGRAVLIVSSNTAGVDAATEDGTIQSRHLWERDLINERLTLLEWSAHVPREVQV